MPADCLARHYFHFITLGIGLITVYVFMIAFEDYDLGNDEAGKRTRINALQSPYSGYCLLPILRLMVFYFLLSFRSSQIARTVYLSCLFLCIPAEFFLHFNHLGLTFACYALYHYFSLRAMGFNFTRLLLGLGILMILKSRFLTFPSVFEQRGYIYPCALTFLYLTVSIRSACAFYMMVFSLVSNEQFQFRSFFGRLVQIIGVGLMLAADYIHLGWFGSFPNRFFYEVLIYYSGQVCHVLSAVDPIFDSGFSFYM